MSGGSHSQRHPVQCNICGADVRDIMLVKNGREILQCPDCGLAFTYPVPERLVEQYDSDYFNLYRKRREFRLARADARLRRIEAIREPGRLLDIGCSLGYFVEAARNRGWDAEGLEISRDAAKEAQRMGLRVRCGVLEDARYEERAFDCVTMWDVLEHVADPTRHMLEVHRILSDNGVVVIGTPDLGHLAFRLKKAGWRHLKPTEHIFYFKRSSIRRLLVKTGFREVRPRIRGVLSGLSSVSARCTQINDVMTVYGVKNGFQIPRH